MPVIEPFFLICAILEQDEQDTKFQISVLYYLLIVYVNYG